MVLNQFNRARKGGIAMRHNCSPPSHHRRAAFTLVELIVVIAIMLTLVGLTVTAVNFSMDSEKTRSASRLVQSYLEGARDRAIYSREPRGVRLLLDVSDTLRNGRRIATGLVFIGPTPPWSEGHIQLERDSTQPGRPVRIVRGFGTAWFDLKVDDLLVNGTRIKIPGDDTGAWYSVLTTRLTSNDEVLVLTTDFRDPGTSDDSQTMAFLGGGPSTYLLELPPTPLSDAEPVLLPEGIAIDLDGSRVPPGWRPNNAATPYRNDMDIMFSPRGTVIGRSGAAGLIHFYIADIAGIATGFDASGIAPIRPINWSQVQSPVIAANPTSGDHMILTLFTRTGSVSSHPVDIEDQYDNRSGAARPDGLADDPYHFAESGEVAGQ